MSAKNLTETIEWTPVEVAMPDTDTTVLVATLELESEPVRPAMWDSENGCWRDVEGGTLGVSHWAPMPEGPK